MQQTHITESIAWQGRESSLNNINMSGLRYSILNPNVHQFQAYLKHYIQEWLVIL